MDQFLVSLVDNVAKFELALPEPFNIRPVEQADWGKLAKLYFDSYDRSTVKTVEDARLEMVQTVNGEFGHLIPTLSPVITVDRQKIVASLMTVAQAPWAGTPSGLFIIELFTHPDFRRKHLAQTSLAWTAIEASKGRHKSLALRVMTHNIGAVALYKKVGFTLWEEEE